MSLPVEDVLAIYQLYARYAHTMDAGDPEGWASCFTPDGSYRSLTGKTHVGAEALTAFAREGIAARKAAGIKTRHWMTNHLLEAEPGGARGKVHLMLLGVKGDGPVKIVATGFYQDQLVKSAQGWQIQTRQDESDRPWRGIEAELEG